MKISIKTKMVVSFLLILTFSCFVTFFGALLISSKPISNEIREGQFSYADSLIRLSKQTDLSSQDIMRVNVNQAYNTKILDTIEKGSLDFGLISRLENGEKIFVTNRIFVSPSTLIKLDDDIVKISVRKNDVFSVFRFRIAMVILSILLLTCALLALLSGRMVKPVMQLTAATQRVASGDFTVSVQHEKNDEVGTLIKNFNKMTSDLSRMEYLQKDFIRNVSHEFKTPISSIQGFAKLLQSEQLTDEERIEYTDIILEETQRLSRLSSNILRLSRLEAMDAVTVKREFLLDEQIRTVIVLLEPKWNAKEIRFDVRMQKISWCGDEELLQPLWINLIENAVKFSYQGGTISVLAASSDHEINVEISDNGPGMSEETKARIFERFYQGSNSHSDEGSGLGMSIVKRILDLTGGKIQIKSSPDQGTSFLIKLPL